MTTATANRPAEAIATLLQERQRYEQWLAALDARRAATPAHVYARVRADYEARLSRVIDELGGRSAELQGVVDALSRQVAALQTEETAKQDLRAEAELRAAVGEYTTDQWRDLSQASDVEIRRLSAQRAEMSAQLAKVQQLLSMATARRATASGAPAPAAASPPASAPGASRPAAAPAAPAAAGGARPADHASSDVVPPRAEASRDLGGARKPGDSTGFDELAFLHSVVEPKADGAPLPPAPPVSPPLRARTPAPAAAAVPAATVSPRVPPPAPPPAPSPAPTAAPTPLPARSTITPPEAALLNTLSVPTSPGERSRRAESDSVPVFLRDVPSEQVKTLKCAECGTMNYPTEWYCERCGGELAAM